MGKVLILFVRSRHCGELNRGSQNLEKFQKDLILFVRDSCLGADSRFAEPRFSRQGIRLVTFCVVQKVTKKHARTCKKLPVASFCASETAETGRIANGREQGDHVSRRSRVATLWTPGERFKALPKVILEKLSGGTCRTRFFAQNGGEKALNRCEVPALQRKELERTAKDQPCSLVNSRLWLGANLRCLR